MSDGIADGGFPETAAPEIAANLKKKRFQLQSRLGRSDRTPLAIWFWELDRVLLGLIMTLITIGLIGIAAASPVTALKQSSSTVTIEPLYYFYRQLGWVAVGVPLMLFVSMAPKEQARRFAIVAAVLAFILLFLVPIMGNTVNGAKRWIGYGFATLQPGEFLKPFYAVSMAWLLSLRVKDPSLPLVPLSIAITGVIALLLLMQPNLGQTIVFCGIWFTLMVVSGLSAKLIAAASVGGIGGLIGSYFFYPVATQRINAWLFGGDEFDQVMFAHKALTGGGLLGTGPGLGTAKFKLPEAHTDYIFSVIGEEFGLLACVAIALVYLAIIVRVFIRLLDEEDNFIILAVAGLTAQFGGQALINISVNLQLFPSKGMTLPFVSYGGSSFLALSMGVGLLLAFTRRNPYLDRSEYVATWSPKGAPDDASNNEVTR
ncbi:FtsW/RodA/SpoVE family cell cycle protein [Parasphingorhabdus halotolerans]|uniref:Probable peptidoglycan glycosyltransferase FtsW n=1 Tax=Parasphingorhabdus halotolerans TaxID=2725558 RepID=A0A6H2DM10_9SPHN|nr:putative peptidoglycan glycosyltransferase FtsW [Parasphingorhabdus halotolerans]QJB69023.1 cell division protein FtsW [Parasphingorhabdus halotolerans]